MSTRVEPIYLKEISKLGSPKEGWGPYQWYKDMRDNQPVYYDAEQAFSSENLVSWEARIQRIVNEMLDELADRFEARLKVKTALTTFIQRFSHAQLIVA
ncbi:hypothetical protein GK047_01110 [Paenibacillus sp. SYP-B3998]|uniref:Uncharacterized protein n=1 Tax=Paenibacillus sp. SYP-B3998 TaxID=2678564 RepID=A0A6G3ZQZ0_9BACL|nr:hypothetical protein [Paenibacillus sp. SYP-B3998]NEW04623.1 hypothetical protein [Paenibacillus sp. SYP-B3998]